MADESGSVARATKRDWTADQTLRGVRQGSEEDLHPGPEACAAFSVSAPHWLPAAQCLRNFRFVRKPSASNRDPTYSDRELVHNALQPLQRGSKVGRRFTSCSKTMVTIAWYAGPARRIAPEPGHFEQPGSSYFRDCAAVARMHADAELLREATIAAESTFKETIHENVLAGNDVQRPREKPAH